MVVAVAFTFPYLADLPGFDLALESNNPRSCNASCDWAVAVCVNCLPSDFANQSRHSPGPGSARQQSFVFERDINIQPEIIY